MNISHINAIEFFREFDGLLPHCTRELSLAVRVAWEDLGCHQGGELHSTHRKRDSTKTRMVGHIWGKPTLHLDTG
jgi:hypothetical protein